MWRLGREYVEAVLCPLDVELVGWIARNFPMSLTGPNTTTCTSAAAVILLNPLVLFYPAVTPTFSILQYFVLVAHKF